MSSYDKISKVELIRFYWENIKNKTLTHGASFRRLHELMDRAKKSSKNTPRIVKLIEQEIKWKKNK